MLGMLRAAVRVRRPPALPAHRQDHAHRQARRLPHPGPAPAGRAARPRRRPEPRPRPALRRRPRAGVPLVARHGTPLSVLFGSNLGTAESIATRLAQEGTERGFDVTLGALDDHVDDLPARRRRAGRLLLLQRDSPGQRRGLLPVDHGRRTTVRPTASPTRSSAAATPSGPGPTRPSRHCSTTSWPLTAAGASGPAARATRPATSTPPTATGTAGSGPTWRRRSTSRPRWASRRPRRAAAVDHADEPAGHQPGHRLLPGAAEYGPGQPRADRRHGRQAAGAFHPPPRDRPHRRARLPGGRPPRGAPAQRLRPRPPGDHPVRARRRPVPHDHPEQRLAHPPADRRAGAAARRARQLCRAAGRRRPRRHRHPCPPHRRPRAEGRARGAGRRRRRGAAALPRPGVRAQPLGARPARAVPGLRAAVRGVPRHAAAAAPALLLHLLLAAGEPGRLQHHRGRAARPARSGIGTFTGIGSGYLACCRSTALSSRSSGDPASRSGHRRTRTPR